MTSPRTKSGLPDIDPVRAAATLCRRRLSFFVREFWDVIIPEPLVWSKHMEVMCDEIEFIFRRVFMQYDEEGNATGRHPKKYDLIINVPPGSSKSTIASVMAPAWGWANDPTLRIIGGSYEGGLAVSLATKSRDIIRSAKYNLYFPHIQMKKDEDGKTDYKNVYGGQRFSTSTGGAVTGEHAHIQIIDDPINPKQAASQSELEKAATWVDVTMSTRKVDKAVTPLILVMQRLAENDPTGHLLKKRPNTIRHVCLPAELDNNVSPAEYRAIYTDGLLDPERMGVEVLKDQKITLGSAGYAGQFGQRPAPLGGIIWKKWFIEVPDADMPDPSRLQKIGSDWDLAYTDDDANSACAYVTAGRLGRDIYITDFDFRWLEFPELISWMKTIQAPHYIEAKASGKSAKPTLTKMGIIAVEVPVKGGADKVARANMATPVAEAGMVKIKKSLADRLYNDQKQGILSFPRGSHTDVADALAQCLQRLTVSVVSNDGWQSVFQ